MKLAAIQFAPTFKDQAYNTRRLSRLIEKAASAGAKLIVMPELATTGYSFMSPEEATPYAEVITEFKPRPTVDPTSSMSVMYALASKLQVALVWGLIEMDYGTRSLYNTQVYIEPDGYFTSYRKVNPWANDYLWAKSGNANPPVVNSDFLGKRVGLLICRDVRDKKNDEWKNFYSKGDADIVAFSTNWGDGGFPSSTWMDFVEDHEVTLVVANRYGQELNNDFGEGGSCIITPKGDAAHPHGVHCDGLVWNQDCVILADVP